MTPQNGLLIFTFRIKIMEIVKDFDEKSYNNNNGKPWKSSRILRVKPNCFIFSLFFHFFTFFIFSIFSFFHFFSLFSFFSFFQVLHKCTGASMIEHGWRQD